MNIEENFNIHKNIYKGNTTIHLSNEMLSYNYTLTGFFYIYVDTSS